MEKFLGIPDCVYFGFMYTTEDDEGRLLCRNYPTCSHPERAGENEAIMGCPLAVVDEKSDYPVIGVRDDGCEFQTRRSNNMASDVK